jgi:hypothetical protein
MGTAGTKDGESDPAGRDEVRSDAGLYDSDGHHSDSRDSDREDPAPRTGSVTSLSAVRGGASLAEATIDPFASDQQQPLATPPGAFQPEPDTELLAALRAGDAEALGRALYNDLEAPALHLRPELRRTVEVAHEGDALGVMISGSGPTIAALARSERHARPIAARWTAADVADAVWMATGPAPGARVIG